MTDTERKVGDPITVLPNRAEPLSITIKLLELAVLGVTSATFHACVG